MSFRIFKRAAWRRESGRYTSRIVPAPKPMDRCRTIHTVATRAEAVAYCTERNDKRPQRGDGALLAPYYEFNEV